LIAGLQLVAVRLGFLQCRRQPAELAFGHRQHHVVFGPELVIDRRFCDPDSVSDHLQRGPADPMLSEQIQRGIERPGARGAVLDDPQLAAGDRRFC
jgi:hypothetical protein